jgi:NAD(P)-dependent dehydrogenase (short-subunit alcohol dehydrogenase family)
LPYLEKGASIINIASVHAHATKDGFSAYSAANGGVISLTKALAVELRHKARVNTVTPGGFLTDEHKNFDKDWESKLEDGQVLKVEEVVNVVLFLLSDKSSGVNGAEILTEVGTSAMRAKSKDW